jgi:hypothetical protein
MPKELVTHKYQPCNWLSILQYSESWAEIICLSDKAGELHAAGLESSSIPKV